MTRTEAIEILNDKAFAFCDIKRCANDYSGWTCKECDEALIMAKEALREKSTEITGYWIEHKRAEIYDGLLQSNFECSECHDWLREQTDYCPSCGKRMRSDVK